MSSIYIMTEDDLQSMLQDAARLSLYYQDNYQKRYEQSSTDKAVEDVMKDSAPAFKVLTAGNVGLRVN